LLRTYRGSCRCSLQAILEGAWLFFGKLRVWEKYRVDFFPMPFHPKAVGALHLADFEPTTWWVFMVFLAHDAYESIFSFLNLRTNWLLVPNLSLFSG
jgi:hypothetical protein